MPTMERYFAIIAVAALLMPQAARPQGNKSKTDPDQQELYAYVLTMDKLHKLADATRDMKEWEKKHPQAEDQMAEKSSEDGSISDKVKAIETKVPEAVTILRKNGLTTREYLVGFFVLLQASMLVSMKKASQEEYPKDATSVVNPANLAFVEQHWDELQKMNLGSEGNKSDDTNEKP